MNQVGRATAPVLISDPQISLQDLIASMTVEMRNPEAVSMTRLTSPELILKVPAYDHDSKPLSLVSFRCMLQDTGYPMEVYLPGQQPQHGQKVDWSQLRERWVGWGVE
jgi:hypothetical protein